MKFDNIDNQCLIMNWGQNTKELFYVNSSTNPKPDVTFISVLLKQLSFDKNILTYN